MDKYLGNYCITGGKSGGKGVHNCTANATINVNCRISTDAILSTAPNVTPVNPTLPPGYVTKRPK